MCFWQGILRNNRSTFFSLQVVNYHNSGIEEPFPVHQKITFGTEKIIVEVTGKLPYCQEHIQYKKKVLRVLPHQKGEKILSCL